MWLLFAISCIIFLAILFLPGYFLFRILKTDRFEPIVYAPLATPALICVIGLIYSKINVFSNAYTIGMALLLFCIVCFVIGSLIKRKRTLSASRASLSRKYYLILLLYIVIGSITTFYMFILPLNGADSFVQMYDNVFHYNTAESFLQSGKWSVLQVDAYLSQNSVAIDPLPGSSFYPAGWHILVAFIASALDASIPLAANSVNAVFIGIVFPIGIYSLLLAIFGKKKRLLIVGAICTTIVSVFPWSLYNQWALYPNATSLCLFPLVASCFITGFNKLLHHETGAICAGTAFIVGILSMLFLQPNSIFTLIIFLFPFCLWKLYFFFKSQNDQSLQRWRIILPSIFLAFIIVLFFIFFKLPFLQSVINYYWPPIMTATQATLSVLSFSLTINQPQWVISLLIITGIFSLVVKNRRNSWLIISYLFAAVIFIVAASEENTLLKHFLCGYWYTDPYRIAAFLGIFSIPLATLGLSQIIKVFQCIIEKIIIGNVYKCNVGRIATILLLVLSYSIVLVPQSPFAGAMTYLKNNAAALNLDGWNYLDSEELEFIATIKSMIPNDSIIINQPYDGSMYAYGVTGLNLYYRDISGYGSKSETEQSKLIRNSLDQLSYNKDVQQAINSIEAQYVLFLKPDFVPQGLAFSTYEADNWTGLESIDESTPGFNLIYEKNHMKLFKIDTELIK